MCRNIKRLRSPGHTPSDQELEDASLQFIRKISGFRTPSRANRDAFETAVHDVAGVSRRLFSALHVDARERVEAHNGGSSIHAER